MVKMVFDSELISRNSWSSGGSVRLHVKMHVNNLVGFPGSCSLEPLYKNESETHLFSSNRMLMQAAGLQTACSLKIKCVSKRSVCNGHDFNCFCNIGVRPCE